MARPRLSRDRVKGTFITLRVTEDLADRFSAAAWRKGANKAILLSQYMVQVARDEEDRDPVGFRKDVERARKERLRLSGLAKMAQAKPTKAK